MSQPRYRETLAHGDDARPWKLYSLTARRGWVFPCHWHPEWELLVVERGTLVLLRGKTEYRLQAGDAAFLNRGDLHTGTTDSEVVLVHALVFRPQFLWGNTHEAGTKMWLNPLEMGTMTLDEVLGADHPAAVVAGQAVQAARRHGPGDELLLRGLLLQLIAALAAGGLFRRTLPHPDSSRIQKVLQMIDDQWAEPLAVNDLARAVYLSPSHFSRLFKSMTGETPVQYLIHRRLSEAARLLREEKRTVSGAATAVGMTHFSAFSRAFRGHFGVTPSQYAYAKG